MISIIFSIYIIISFYNKYFLYIKQNIFFNIYIYVYLFILLIYKYMIIIKITTKRFAIINNNKTLEYRYIYEIKFKNFLFIINFFNIK